MSETIFVVVHISKFFGGTETRHEHLLLGLSGLEFS